MGLQREHINLTSTCIDIEYYCNSGLRFVSVALNVGATFKRCDKPWGLVMWGPSIGEAAVVLLLHWKNFGKRWKNFALPSFLSPHTTMRFLSPIPIIQERFSC